MLRYVLKKSKISVSTVYLPSPMRRRVHVPKKKIFVWHWILHVWNGFYTLCHSKIGLFNNWLQLDNFGLLPPSDCPPYSLINNHLYCLKTTIVRKPKPSVKHILLLLDCFIGVFRHQESLLMVPFELFQQVFQRAPFDSCSVLPEKF